MNFVLKLLAGRKALLGAVILIMIAAGLMRDVGRACACHGQNPFAIGCCGLSHHAATPKIS